MKIEQTKKRMWTADGVTVIEETPGGNFEVRDWCALDVDRLKRLHAVLGVVLTDLATEAAPLDSADVDEMVETTRPAF